MYIYIYIYILSVECTNIYPGGGRRLGSCYSNQGGINGQNYNYGGQSNYGPLFGGPGLGVAVGVCCSSEYRSLSHELKLVSSVRAYH